MSKQPHINTTAGQIAKHVIVCGEPDRVNRIAAFLDNAELIADNREYRVINGFYHNQMVTVCSTGIGAPSAIIALEELNNCGAKFIVRVGSAGALQADIGLGDLIIAEAAVRDEGGSKAYVDAQFPAYASHRLVAGLEASIVQQAYPAHSGMVRSHDSFYTDDEDKICQYWSEKGVLGADMETSALFTVGKLRGLQVAAVLNNVVLYQQDVKDGVNQYISADEVMLKGERAGIKAALHALSLQI
ncbi:nucleoside phosphorylase [Photobacterium sp.]|uniref:nucleoside phosphorylase n=1 Tax=Photobacterium sp. TaxID=660 RepID=UPI00299E9380|nr:nucleoside phosphorylase [Photobacterium sp.]MDX1300849.1 nucleoside phosphorylase [Photobacterium sp.]